MSKAQRHGGFTLIELLVAMSLMLFLLSTATLAFVQVKSVIARSRARQVFHDSLRTTFEHLHTEISSMSQTNAWYLASTPETSSGAGDATVELVFMRGKFDSTDFTTRDRFGMDSPSTTDLVWSRWAWEQKKSSITAASSLASRSFPMTQAWISPGGKDFSKSTAVLPAQYGSLPSSRRQAVLFNPGTATFSAPATAANLDLNTTWRINTDPGRDDQDLGDYSSLVRRAVPITNNCTECVIEAVLLDGSTIRVAPDAAKSFAFDGAYVNGGGQADVAPASTSQRKRPRLIRFIFTLTDPTTKQSEPFTLSVQAPNLALGP